MYNLTAVKVLARALVSFQGSAEEGTKFTWLCGGFKIEDLRALLSKRLPLSSSPHELPSMAACLIKAS